MRTRSGRAVQGRRRIGAGGLALGVALTGGEALTGGHALTGGGRAQAQAVQAVVDVAPAATVAEPFTRIRGVAELPGGRLLVADQREGAVYLIGADGARRVLGRTGSGPGEYRDPVGLLPWSGDSVLINDLQNGRFVVVSPAGELGRVFVQVSGPDMVIPRGADEAGSLYFDRVIDVRLRKRDGERIDQAPLVRKPPAGVLDTIAQLTIPGPGNPNAFPAWDAWAAGRDGRIAIVRNQDAYRVDWVLPDGSAVRGVVVDEPALAVTDDDRTAWQSANGGRGMRSSVSFGGSRPTAPPAVEFPDRFPPAKAIHVSEDGRALVVRHQPLAETRPLIDVFDASGRRTARLRLPAGREVVAVGRSLYAFRTDDDGFQWLERYELP
jgi:hypothetical protein